MEYKVLLPQTIWQNHDPSAGDFAAEIVEQDEGRARYLINAYPATGDTVRVSVRIFKPRGDVAGTLVVVPEYHRIPDRTFTERLVAEGFCVVLPDLSGLDGTVFPPALEYGFYDRAGEHLQKVMPTALQTSQYLYTVILKRTLAFLAASEGGGDKDSRRDSIAAIRSRAARRAFFLCKALYFSILISKLYTVQKV